MSRESPTLDELYGVGAEEADAQGSVSPCDMTRDCRAAVTHIGEKGYVYCTAHAGDRRGVERCRKMRKWECDLIAQGKPLPSYKLAARPESVRNREHRLANEWSFPRNQLVRVVSRSTYKNYVGRVTDLLPGGKVCVHFTLTASTVCFEQSELERAVFLSGESK